MDLLSHAITTTGRRSNNEDDLCAVPRLGLFAVADGLGSTAGSVEASELTLDALARAFGRIAHETRFAPPPTLALRLREAVLFASEAVRAERRGARHAMGATLAAIAFGPTHVAIANVGDARAYRLRERAFEMLTVDHSIRAVLLAEGVDPSLCARYGHLVTRASGSVDDSHEVAVRLEPHRPGDRYLICSDGVAEYLPAESLRGLVALASPRQATRQLLARALERDSDDNVTALVVALPPQAAARSGRPTERPAAPSRGTSAKAHEP